MDSLRGNKATPGRLLKNVLVFVGQGISFNYQVVCQSRLTYVKINAWVMQATIKSNLSIGGVV